MRSTTTAQPGLHSLYRTGSGGGTCALGAATAGFAAAAFDRLPGRARCFDRKAARRAAVRLVRVARMVSALNPRPSIRCGLLASIGFAPVKLGGIRFTCAARQ